ncbi:MAG: 3-dehydro-L-gulonate 2-dehydrogenase [Flammeovirgaceae bacterium]|nr:3-dehydro-L-gulonate 2-dehydrogenase [Flammeovirgaceae bacterium]
MRVQYKEAVQLLTKKLILTGYELERAKLCATLFVDASRDGVYSHGLNRFASFIHLNREGYVKADTQPEVTDSSGAIERWDGKMGAGMLNAHSAMGKAIQLANSNGLGCVAIKDTNHWMRGGNFGWQAAEAGCIGICFTNTKPNMPPWGAKEPRTGNNPLVIAIPRSSGHVVLDMSMSQFSFGKMIETAKKGKKLPFHGGFDNDGNLTDDPDTVVENELSLPIGYWKGSGLSIMLDMLVTILSGGRSTRKIGEDEVEFGISQVFICIKPDLFGSEEENNTMLNNIINYLHQSELLKRSENVLYPGERTLKTRKENMENGIPVEKKIWEEINKL